MFKYIKMTDYIEIENLIFHKETNVKEYWIDMFKHPMWNMNYYDEPTNFFKSEI